MTRASELKRITAAIQAIKEGRSQVLIVVGEAGIGKSWLCERAATSAQREGMRVVRTRGLESERHLEYAGLIDLLPGLLGDVQHALAPPRRSALAAALRLADGAVTDPLAVNIACLDVLTAAAERTPLLAIVDDVQWTDRASAAALRFAARRLQRDRVGMLFAMRPDELEPFRAAGFPALVVEGLSSSETRSLIREVAPVEVHPEAERRIVETAGGHPLALVEAIAALSPDQLAGRGELPDAMPTPRTLRAGFEQRLASLPASGRAAAALKAVAGDAPPAIVAGALARASLSESALEPARQARLLDDSGAFVHPLAHLVSAGAAQPESHLALSREWREAGDEERAAWHLAEATSGIDGDVSQALAKAAAGARERGASSLAADLALRAADAADDTATAARLRIEGAVDLVRSGRPDDALAALDDVSRDERAPAEVAFLRGQALWAASRLDDAHAVLMEAATRKDFAVAPRVRMFCLAGFTRAIAGDVTACAAAMADAARLAEHGGPAERVLAEFGAGWAETLAGDGDHGYPRFRRAWAEMPGAQPIGSSVVPPYGQLASWMEDFPAARAELSRTVAEARDRGALRDLAYALAALSELEFRTGDWMAARAHLTESVDLASLTDLHSGFASCELGRLEAVTGSTEPARAHIRHALELAEQMGSLSLPIYAHSALGLLELGSGDTTVALEHLLAAGRFARASGLGEPNVVQWEPDLIEAYARLGQVDAAELALAGFERQAERTGRRWTHATARRCRGLLVDAGSVDAVFGDAERLTDALPYPFENGRLHLCWGERLRRDGRRVEARRQLSVAFETFDSLGATPWTERAARELTASGARARRGTRTRSAELTPQETQVALLVAEGMTNKQVAGQLFLSPKTVEFHLGHIFRKLDVRTRTQLGAVLRARSGSGTDRGIG